MKPLITTLCLLLLALPSHGSWGAGCGPVGPVSTPTPASVAPDYQWVKSAPGEYALMLNGYQIGAVRAEDGAYFALRDGQWRKGQCPCDLPAGVTPSKPKCDCGCNMCRGCKCNAQGRCSDTCECGRNQAEAAEQPITGVEADKVEESKGKHSVNGIEVSKEEVIRAIQKASIPKDQSKLRLTVIGEKSQTDAILADLKAIPDASDMLVSAFPSDAWQVKDSGLSAGKAFSIVLQAPSGKVLHRQWDYEGGQKSLSEALRDAKADYQAGNDPDRRSSDLISPLIEKLKTVPMEVWAIVGVLVFLYLRHQEQQKKGQ